MSISDQCFTLILKNDVMIDDDLKEKITNHISGWFTDSDRFGDDALSEEERIPIEVYLGLVWKKRKAACISISTRAKDKLEKIHNILSKLDSKDLKVDKDISLTRPGKIEHCDFERFKKKKGDKLWDKLEHNGPYFSHIFEPYQPVGMDIIYDKKKYKLSPVEEQTARFWANRIITESKPTNKKFFIKNKTFRDNFFNTWKEYFTPEHRKIWTDFSKFNFDPIVKKIEELKEEKDEIKKSRSIEEKLEEKVEKLERKLNYNYAFVDGVKKELKSYAVEVQGLYVGAGNVMTHKGKIKKLIQPEDVTINVSKGDEPNAPPGHRWGGIVHEPTSGWTARYKDEITGQYKYVRLKESGDLLKFEKARKLNKFIHIIDNKINTLLKKDNMIDRQMGTVIYLIKNFGFRVGTEESDEQEGDEGGGEKVVGATTLEVRNIKPLDDNQIDLRFFGKDSQLYENTLEVSPEIYKNIVDFTKGKKDTAQLFDKVSASDVNSYLKSIDRDFTAKVFRTRLASKTMFDGLQNFLDYKKGATDEEKIADFNTVNKDVAIKLNHKKGITEANKLSLKNDKAKIDIAKSKLKELEEKLEETDKDEKRKKIKESIKKIKEKIKVMNTNLKDKKGNLGIALETSKKNYIDPRVVKAWAETVDVPITKVYKSKELQKHFKWALEDEDFDLDFDYEDTPLDCIVGSELEPKLEEEKRVGERKISNLSAEKPKREKKPKTVVLKEKPFLVDYSPRALALFGDTKPFVEALKKLRGSFNPSLTYQGEKRPGWVFLKMYKKDVEEWLNKLSYFVEDVEKIEVIKEKKERINEVTDVDEDAPLGDILSKVKSLSEIADEESKIEDFCKNITQNLFNKLKKSTREDFHRFSLVVLKIGKGDVEVAKKILKLKV